MFIRRTDAVQNTEKKKLREKQQESLCNENSMAKQEDIRILNTAHLVT